MIDKKNPSVGSRLRERPSAEEQSQCNDSLFSKPACTRKGVRGAHLAGALRARAAEPRGGREAAPLHARTPADMLRDVLGGEEPSAEAFLREVAPALVGAMDDGRGHAGACGGGAARAARRLARHIGVMIRVAAKRRLLSI